MSHNATMYVVKRGGQCEELSLDKIAKRLRFLANSPTVLSNVNIMEITIAVVGAIINNISTSELDDIAAWECSSRATEIDEYETLATRIAISNNHKNTKNKFSLMIKDLGELSKPTIRSEIVDLVLANADTYDNMIVDDRDNLFDYFGIKTLEKIYLLILNGKVVERPQYMWMRTAVELHRDNIPMVKETYDMLSQHYFTHASPTLFNACTVKPQLSSCMLLTNAGDSIEGIYETLKQCSILGATSGGLGVSVSNIRATGSTIGSSKRESKGVPGFLTLHNLNCTIIDQGGKRKMSEAIYIEPWHADFPTILHMRANDNTTPLATKELFYAVWSNNLLYQRARDGKDWSFFCPVDAPKLLSTYGDEFEKIYVEYENAGLARSTMSAQELYVQIAIMMNETGMPYHLNKDACNAKSNMKNVGHLNSSNLCAEILIPSGFIDGHNEIGVCTLASINLTKFVTPIKYSPSGEVISLGEYNFNELHRITQVACTNLNLVIDNQLYPLIEGEISSKRHRPIGIGIQGLANVFQLMGMPYESVAAKELNWRIAETIYHGALTKSMDLAKTHGSYETFIGSPASQGKLQPHLWIDYGSKKLNYNYDWDELAKSVQTTGLRNALVVAYMPTASTSQLFGNFSSFEPATANIFARHTLAGTFIVLNKHLVSDLKNLNLWNKNMKDKIIALEGSVQNLSNIPEHIRKVYKTVWEMRTSHLMDMSADRGQFIDHTQSFNLYIANPSIKKTTAIIMYGMKLGLKTISYYTRSRAARDAVKQTVDRSIENELSNNPAMECTDDVCYTCQS